MARACNALVRAKKVQTPEPLGRVVCLSCGWDNPVREVAGTCTALYESLTDHAVAARWRAGGPGVQARLRQRRPRSAGATRPHGRRLGVIDGRRRPAPGAPGPAQRLQSALALRPWAGVAGLSRAVPTGAPRTPCTLGAGAGALAARG